MMGGKATNGNGADHQPAPSPGVETSGEPQSDTTARLDLLNPSVYSPKRVTDVTASRRWAGRQLG